MHVVANAALAFAAINCHPEKIQKAINTFQTVINGGLDLAAQNFGSTLFQLLALLYKTFDCKTPKETLLSEMQVRGANNILTFHRAGTKRKTDRDSRGRLQQMGASQAKRW
jgi:hypothetical protein